MSQIAKGRATQANTIEFVGLELEEADTVISLLKGLGIPTVILDANESGFPVPIYQRFSLGSWP